MRDQHKDSASKTKVRIRNQVRRRTFAEMRRKEGTFDSETSKGNVSVGKRLWADREYFESSLREAVRALKVSDKGSGTE